MKNFYILKRMGKKFVVCFGFQYFFLFSIIEKSQKMEIFLIFFCLHSMPKYLNVYNFYRYIHKIQFNKVSHYWFYRKLLASISLPYRLYHNVECFIRYIYSSIRMYIHISVYIFIFIHFSIKYNALKIYEEKWNESVEENEDEIDGKWWME